MSCRHHSLTDFRKRVEDEIGTIEGMIGYVEPSHGQKGKQRELSNDEDLMEMYIIHRSKRDILLWSCGDVEGQDLSSVRKSRKRPHSNEFEHVSTPPNKRDSIAKNLSEVEIAIKELKDKHGDMYPREKLNAWAHLINVGKHHSYDEPPDFPFFKKPKGKIESSTPKNCGSTSSTQPFDSPSKRLSFRTQCIQQLTNRHSLYETGAIFQEQYDELKESILDDIKTVQTS